MIKLLLPLLIYLSDLHGPKLNVKDQKQFDQFMLQQQRILEESKRTRTELMQKHNALSEPPPKKARERTDEERVDELMETISIMMIEDRVKKGKPIDPMTFEVELLKTRLELLDLFQKNRNAKVPKE
jgi:hypothetical protein